MSPQDQKELSKYMSLLLRHQPEKAGLVLDSQGYVTLSVFIDALRASREWSGIGEGEVREVVRDSDKQRYEISDGKIRARYGHSVPEAVLHEEVSPPEILYHGTSPNALPAILSEGLSSMNRQYVHLSTEVNQAMLVGRRHHPRPVILVVRAQEAWKSGIKFYRPEARLYLSESVPPGFISTEEKS